MSSTTIAIDDTYYKSLLLQMETADAKFTPTKFWKVALEKMSDELLNGDAEHSVYLWIVSPNGLRAFVNILECLGNHLKTSVSILECLAKYSPVF